MTAQMNPSETSAPQRSFSERILEAVLLSAEPVGARTVTEQLYGEATTVRIANVRRALHELTLDGVIACIERPGKERLAWSAPYRVLAHD